MLHFLSTMLVSTNRKVMSQEEEKKKNPVDMQW